MMAIEDIDIDNKEMIVNMKRTRFYEYMYTVDFDAEPPYTMTDVLKQIFEDGRNRKPGLKVTMK